MSATMPSRWLFIATVFCLAMFPLAAIAQAQSAAGAARAGTTMTYHAKGSFEPTLKPVPPDDKAEGATLGRMAGSKKWHGDLDGTSTLQMLTAITSVKGSAAYVAIERVTGTLNGRHGSFVLQHTGTMNRGAPHLTITSVPDSGTGELAGIVITNFILRIEPDGKHFYDFDYTLPAKP